MWAFAVPGGYCPAPTRLTLAPKTVSLPVGHRIDECGTLTAFGRSLPRQPVRFFVDRAFAGVRITDGDGRACVPFDGVSATRGLVRVRAAFLGSTSYLPSNDDGTIGVVAGAGLSQVPSLVGPLGQWPPPQAPHPGVGPAAQTQPQPNGNPDPVAQANPQALLAQQRQEQPQLALVYASEQVRTDPSFGMARRDPRSNDPADGVRLFGAGLALLSVGVARLRVRYAYSERRQR
jgi:hypothetical protein